MDKQQILEIAKNDPRFSKAILTLENQIGDMPITTEGLDELVKLLEFALNNPDKYPEIVASAVQDDMVEEGDLPEQFDPVIIISLLVLLYGMQERHKAKRLRKGWSGGYGSSWRHDAGAHSPPWPVPQRDANLGLTNHNNTASPTKGVSPA